MAHWRKLAVSAISNKKNIPMDSIWCKPGLEPSMDLTGLCSFSTIIFFRQHAASIYGFVRKSVSLCYVRQKKI